MKETLSTVANNYSKRKAAEVELQAIVKNAKDTIAKARLELLSVIAKDESPSLLGRSYIETLYAVSLELYDIEHKL